MSKNPMLQEILNSELGARNIKRLEVPGHIETNLNPRFPLREYQRSAFNYFQSYFDEEFSGKPAANHHLLFHMATGSGKTLIMAGLILDLYARGYRNFLFFVNNTSIIEKTKDNFLGKNTSKYLFAPELAVDGRSVNVNGVSNFSESRINHINIIFTTIQDLHSQILIPRENGISIEDLARERFVLISDEAHHVNVDTKKKIKKQGDDKNQALEQLTGNWETTVETIFKANPSNVLLEFTATMDLENSAILEKYRNKIIFDYPLREFRRDGYSKEVSVEVFDTQDLMERAMLAVLLSQYRKRVMLKHKIGSKPVILFKSKTIEESRRFQMEFSRHIHGLDLTKLQPIFLTNRRLLGELEKSILESQGGFDSFILELQEDFSEDRHLLVNSKDESEEKQIALNSLEDSDNGFRCIFAVDKLNEGWDVLNLFDIVRLYDTRDPTGNTALGAAKVGKTTMSEAQLIGRGARYYPFNLSDDDEKFKRKFDFDSSNELRICETLSYHSAHNPKYIQELNSALLEIGMKSKVSTTQDLIVKPSFRKSRTFGEGLIFLNQKLARSSTNSPRFGEYIRTIFKVSLQTGQHQSLFLFSDQNQVSPIQKKVFEATLAQFDSAILLEAINALPKMSFATISRLFPDIISVQQFLTSTEYLASVKVSISSSHESLEDLNVSEKLLVCKSVISQIDAIFQKSGTDFVGSKEFKPFKISSIIRDKQMNFNIDPDTEEQTGKSMIDPSNTYHLDLENKEWYVFNDCFGTSEEKLLVKYIDRKMSSLQDKYTDIYLIRNEKFFKIYNFATGEATEPDFLLLLRSEVGDDSNSMQVFIEPKGEHLMANDRWKEDLLLSLKFNSKVTLLTESEDYLVWGLPFYNNQHEFDFDSSFDELLLEPPID